MGTKRVAERTPSGLAPLQGRCEEEAPKAPDDRCHWGTEASLRVVRDMLAPPSQY